MATNCIESNFYIESIEPLVANIFYDLVQVDFICTLYQVEKDTRSNVCFFECISGAVASESPDCLLLSGTVVGENPDYVCWVRFYVFFQIPGSVRVHNMNGKCILKTQREREGERERKIF